MKKHEQNVLDFAVKLDALIEDYGEITKIVSDIVENKNDKQVVVLLKRISNISNSEDYSKESKKVAVALRNSLIDYFGFCRIQEIFEKEKQFVDNQDHRSLDELLEELNSLIGLEKVKNKVYDLIAYQKVQQMRKANSLFSTKNTLHLAFTGNPGTGKTTVARIVGRIYKQIGLLSVGHFVEVSRTDLIAGYQGQTALKVKGVIDKARGGVLFIDEAYSITENDHSDSYGRECLTELTKALEDYRDDLVVIVAGYTEPMNKFFESNPGLKSRFNTFIEFDDYDANELNDILFVMCKNNDYCIDDEAKEIINMYFEKQISDKNENFANGRLARNLYDNLVMNHAKRVVKIDNPTKDDLSLIKKEDTAFLISDEQPDLNTSH